MRQVDRITGEIKGEPFNEERLVRMLGGLLKLKYTKRDSEEAYRKALKPYEDWLLANPGQELRDGELGIVARWQEGGSVETMDVMAMAEAEPEALLDLCRHGVLRLDVAAWKALRAKMREAVPGERFVYKEPRRGYVDIQQQPRR